MVLWSCPDVNVGSVFNKAAEHRDEYLQFFGSRVGREGTYVESAPGPGDYEVASSQFKGDCDHSTRVQVVHSGGLA